MLYHIWLQVSVLGPTCKISADEEIDLQVEILVMGAACQPWLVVLAINSYLKLLKFLQAPNKQSYKQETAE